MKYIANPVVVDAWAIKDKRQISHGGHLELVLDKDGADEVVRPSLEMTARFSPEVGDYYVVQDDGYAYLNPKSVFERKYKLQVEGKSKTKEAKNG